MDTMKNLVIEEDNKNNISFVEDGQVTDQFCENLPSQSEIEDEQINASDEM